MSRNSYDEILGRARKELSADEQLRLINELCRYAGAASRKHSICELEGLGKHIWQGIDAGEYVRQERDSWSG